MAGWWAHRCCRRNACFLLFGSVVVVVVLYQWYMSTRVPILKQRGLNRPNVTKRVLPKRVLLWTKFFSQTQWVKDDHFKYCPESRCIVTEDKSLLLYSDAVLFHERDIGGRDQMPRVRTSEQRWIWLTQETAMNLEAPLSDYNGIFNWTMTYRRDSDVVIPYGAVRKMTEPLTMEELRKLVAEESPRRRKLIAIRISNCNSPFTDRMNYVRKLQEYVQVDVLGKCGESCKQHGGCSDAYMLQYKFYLAFENSHCRDYITEKLWLPLAYWHNVPVVMGGADPSDYAAVAPPNSYIHVDSFKSPQKLAEYLKLLDKNDTLYNEYFNWRRTHEYTFPPYCDLCAALHSPKPRKTYNLVQWYKSDTCSADHPVYV